MSLRERKDCTEEELVPRASAIHSSVFPASTHSLICSMWGFNAMRFLESAMLYRLLLLAFRPLSEGCYIKWFIDELSVMSRHSTISRTLFPVGGARLSAPSGLGRGRLILPTCLLLDAGGVLRLGILHSRGLFALSGVLADLAAGGCVLRAGLFLPFLP